MINKTLKARQLGHYLNSKIEKKIKRTKKKYDNYKYITSS
jgi:hypothetical protein